MSADSDTQAATVQTVEPPLQKPLIATAQLLVFPLMLMIRLLLVRRALQRHPNLYALDRQATYVLYGNHQSMLDPLILCAALPVRSLPAVLPFRYFIENSYFKGLLKPLLYSLGGFPAHHQPRTAYGLGKARSVLATGQTVVIFPPGRRTRQPIAKPGIMSLAAEPNVQLIPAHIDWQSRWRCRIRLGAAYSADSDSTPESLMQQVYDLADFVPTTT